MKPDDVVHVQREVTMIIKMIIPLLWMIIIKIIAVMMIILMSITKKIYIYDNITNNHIKNVNNYGNSNSRTVIYVVKETNNNNKSNISNK